MKKRHNSRSRTKILIADVEGIFRLGLKKLFSVEDDLRVVAQAENSRQLVSMAKTFRPDLAIVQQEIALNEYQGLLAQIRQDSPNCKVVLTTSRLRDKERNMLYRDGVLAMIPRAAQPELFVKNVKKVIRGETLKPWDARNNKQTYAGGADDYFVRPIDTLTPRERVIISCLTQGWRNRDIAEHLTISEQTVKNHLRSIYDKVGVSDRLELVLYAIHQRLELPPINTYT